MFFTNIFCILNGFTSPPFPSFFVFSWSRSRLKYFPQFLPIIHRGSMGTHINTHYFIRSRRRRHSCESLPWHPTGTVFSSNPRPSALAWPLAMASIFTRFNFLPIYRFP